MYATDFQFDKELASSYGVMICTFDGTGGTASFRNGADVTLTTVRAPGSNTWNHVYSQYSEVLSATFQISKIPCKNKDLYFDAIEQRAINRWLNRLDKFYPFRIIQDGYDNIYFNAQINVNKIELNGRVIGFELTITTDKPYGYFEEQELLFDIAADGSYSFVNISDDIGRNDTRLKITCLADGSLTINNSATTETLTLLNCSNNEVIEFDTQNKKITSNMRTNADLLKAFNFKWLYISNTMESRRNTLTFSLPARVELHYHPVCKISF